MRTEERSTPHRWKRRPEPSTWDDFGDDDVLGRLNLITPEKVLEAAREVRAGRSFCLSLPLDLPGGTGLNPNRYPPVVRPNRRAGGINFNFEMSTLDAERTDVLCDDLAVLHLQYSTQWDSFAHVGAMFDVDDTGTPAAVYYNGYRAGTDVLGPDKVEDSGHET